jgi:hypothetical protein
MEVPSSRRHFYRPRLLPIGSVTEAFGASVTPRNELEHLYLRRMLVNTLSGKLALLLASAVLAHEQDRPTITQAERVHRTQTLYDAVTFGNNAPWQQISPAVAENDSLGAFAQSFFEALRCPKTLVRFSAAEGAGDHCERQNRSLLNRRVLDWLDEQFGL